MLHCIVKRRWERELNTEHICPLSSEDADLLIRKSEYRNALRRQAECDECGNSGGKDLVKSLDECMDSVKHAQCYMSTMKIYSMTLMS